MQLIPQRLRPAEEDTRFRRSVDLANGLENRVPVRSAEIRRRPQSRDGILVCVGVIDHDVGGVIRFDVSSEILVAKR